MGRLVYTLLSRVVHKEGNVIATRISKVFQADGVKYALLLIRCKVN